MRLNTILAVFLCAAFVTAAQTRTTAPSTHSAQQASTVPQDAKRAKSSYERGVKAEKQDDWVLAFAAYSAAVQQDSRNREYLLRREIARGKVVGEKVDRAEQDAVMGDVDQARAGCA